jgi:hypothetical protein
MAWKGLKHLEQHNNNNNNISANDVIWLGNAKGSSHTCIEVTLLVLVSSWDAFPVYFECVSHLAISREDCLCGLVVEFLAAVSEVWIRFPALPDFQRSSGCTLVSTIEELLWRKSSGSGLESREYGRRDPSRWLRGTLYPQILTPISPPLSLGRYSSLADSGYGVQFRKNMSFLVTLVSILALCNSFNCKVVAFSPEKGQTYRNYLWKFRR